MADSMRPKAEIEAEVEAARDRLATGITSLINEIHPRAIAHRAAADARNAASSKVRALRSQLVRPDGSLDLTRAGLVAAAAAGVVAFFAVIRSIRR